MSIAIAVGHICLMNALVNCVCSQVFYSKALFIHEVVFVLNSINKFDGNIPEF